MEKVIGGLGESFQNTTGIPFTFNPTGSSSGIKAVSDGRCDIGLSSRALKESEISSGLKGTILALDGIAIIVNTENPISDLSPETLSKIYTGTITNWKEIGGSNSEIVLIGREAGSGTRDGFENVIHAKDMCVYRQELTSTGDVLSTVSQNPAAIGYASIASVQENVKILSVEGVFPTNENIKNETYIVQRPFVLVTKADTKLSDAAQMFLDYAISDEANWIIEKMGLVAIH